MALVIEQRFPAGRYHATRWNQNSYEDPFGEWPPSPWRLLRAVAARWFEYARETGDADAGARDRLLSALAALPQFYVPAASWRGPAIRQYVPTGVEWSKAQKKDPGVREPKPTLALDTYRAVPEDDAVFWVWPEVDLEERSERLLDEVLRRILYFGRAESRCTMRRVQSLPAAKEPNCNLQRTGAAGRVPVLALAEGAGLDIDVLLSDTDGRALKGKPIPPGCAWHYAEPPAADRASRVEAKRGAEFPYLQFAAGGRVWPRASDWVTLTQRFRGRILKRLAVRWTGDPRAHYGTLNAALRERAALVAGKDADGRPLLKHEHARLLFWPDGEGHPQRLILWREQPFSEEEGEAAFEAAEQAVSWMAGAAWSMRLIPLPRSTPLPAGFAETGTVWESVTPFVPPLGRHRFRANGRERAGETAEACLTRLAIACGYPKPARIAQLEKPAVWVRLHETRARRLDREENRTRLVRPGLWMRVEFPEPVRGPLMLGDSAHFGLGVFRVVE